MKTTLVDTGPLAAYLNRNDQFHSWALDLFAETRPPLLTCEAVLSEAAFLTSHFGGGEHLMDLIQRGLVRVEFRLGEQAEPVRSLLKRYDSLPMDLADACLVRMTELHSDCVLLTIDSEFRDVYRRRGRRVIPCVLPPGLPQRKRHNPRRRAH